MARTYGVRLTPRDEFCSQPPEFYYRVPPPPAGASGDAPSSSGDGPSPGASGPAPGPGVRGPADGVLGKPRGMPARPVTWHITKRSLAHAQHIKGAAHSVSEKYECLFARALRGLPLWDGRRCRASPDPVHQKRASSYAEPDCPC